MGDAGEAEWRFKQCFGERRSLDTIQDGDMLTAVEFSTNGDLLATGDRAGRVVIFEQSLRKNDDDEPERNLPLFSGRRSEAREKQRHRRTASFKFQAEFKSHSPDFDCLKSLEIEEKINAIRWCRPTNDALFLLTTNDKTVKLWKVCESSSRSSLQPSLRGPVTVGNGSRRVEPRLRTRERRVFANAHAYHINGLAINCNGETYLSSDDLRINLWHLDNCGEVYTVVDIKPENMEELSEVITGCCAHPTSSSLFVHSTSRGALSLNDLRSGSSHDRYATTFREVSQDQGGWGDQAAFYHQHAAFFGEILASVSDVTFCEDERQLAARDFLSIKIWDVRRQDRPCETINFLNHLRPKIRQLYRSDSIFDKFSLSCGQNGLLATGSYSDRFYLFDRQRKQSTCVDVLSQEARNEVNQYNMPQEDAMQVDQEDEREGDDRFPEHRHKALHLALHPDMNCVAVAVENNLYVYGQ